MWEIFYYRVKRVKKITIKLHQLDALATSVSLNVSVNGDAVDEINGNLL